MPCLRPRRNYIDRCITYRFLAAPVQANRDFFLAYLLYISTVSTFLNIRASYWSASSGFRLLGEIPKIQLYSFYSPFVGENAISQI